MFFLFYGFTGKEVAISKWGWLKRYGFSRKQNKDIVMDDLTVDRDNNVAFISKEKFFYFRNNKFTKSSKKSCYSGVASGPES